MTDSNDPQVDQGDYDYADIPGLLKSHDALFAENARLRELLTALVSDDAARGRIKAQLAEFPNLADGEHRGIQAGTYYDTAVWNWCVYCDRESDDEWKHTVHAADCPILLAQQALGIAPTS